MLVWWKLEEPQQNIELKQNLRTKLKRIDVVGAFFMSLSILACITAVDLGSKKATPTMIAILTAVGVAAAVCFVLAEKFWAKEPIFPLELLGKDAVITSYTIMFIQTGIQVSVSATKRFLFLIFVLMSVTSSCSWRHYTSRLLPMQVWAKPVHTLFLLYLETQLVVFLSALISSGKSFAYENFSFPRPN